MQEQRGISTSQAIELKKKFGNNLLPTKESNSWHKILFSQLANPLIMLLVCISFISILLKEKFDAFLIILVIIFNVITGFIQEFSAKKTLAALKKIIKSRCMVVRDDTRIEIETRDLVPGDVVVLSSGDKVPADGRIIGETSLLINEAILTGEEEAVEKSFENNTDELFMGTIVVSGQGLMVVEKIGNATKIGEIGRGLSEIKETETPLQARLQQLTKSLMIAVFFICLSIFLLGISRGGDILQTLSLAVILSIAAIPEGLPIAITVILAIGVRRILKKQGLVKKLLSIETLGSTSVICLDKTGTLTEGIMKVVKTHCYQKKENFLFALTMLNDRKSAIEVAMWKYLTAHCEENLNTTFDSYQRILVEPFDSAKKYKMVVNQVDDKKIAYIMGAPEIILNFCKESSVKKNELIKQISEWAHDGLRIIGVAQKNFGNLSEKNGFTWLGLVGIEDPVRKEVKEMLKSAQRAGIKIKIVTGDYQITAEQVAKKVGIDIQPHNVLNFEDLEIMSDDELAKKIDSIKLFSRVSPSQKLRIIKVLQQNGEIVAMTGDGVNDALALKKADIGIVVENGTDVAKETGDLILLDNNFKTIISACEEGRVIFSNIKKVVGYVLSNSFAEIILITGSMFLNFPTPILVAQILWIHLICDGPPDIMLGFEPKEDGIMDLKPSEIQQESILSKKMQLMIFAVSLSVGLFGLAIFWYYNSILQDIVLARTIVFTFLALVSLVYIFAFKDLTKTTLKAKAIFNNKYLNLSVIYGLTLVIIAIYVPFFNKILNTVPLSFNHWVVIGSLCILVTTIVEFIKISMIKRNRYQ